MKDFEEELDEIRVELFEEIKGMDKEDVIKSVNSHAHKIALEHGIKIEPRVKEEQHTRSLQGGVVDF